MLIFAHAGITLGAATLIAGATNYKKPQVSWLATLSRYVDIRLLLVGSLLPDIIDKPVGQYFFRETFSNGRIFSHTLLFLAIISVIGLYLFRRYRQVWLISLAAGSFLHLTLDSMWNAPATLFWPFMGLAFEKIELAAWAGNIWEALLSDPTVYLPEAAGLLILLWFGVVLVRKRQIGIFIRYGKVR